MEPNAPNPSPAPAAAPAGLLEKPITRRNFLWTAWAAFAAFLGGGAASMGRFMFPNVLYEPSQIFKAGRPEDYSVGVSTRWMKEQRVWIIRESDHLFALWARCTHLGCTPNWFEAEKRFKCPCHGSNYTIEGDVIAGPAPKPMNRCAVALLPTGEIQVDKSILEDRPGLRDKPQFQIPVKA